MYCILHDSNLCLLRQVPLPPLIHLTLAMHNTGSDQLSILQWNCKSIVNKRDELYLLIDEYKPDVIALNETWLSETQNFYIPGFKTARKDPNGHGHGHVLLAFKDDLDI